MENDKVTPVQPEALQSTQVAAEVCRACGSVVLGAVAPRLPELASPEMRGSQKAADKPGFELDLPPPQRQLAGRLPYQRFPKGGLMGAVEWWIAGEKRNRRLREISNEKSDADRRARLVRKGLPSELVALYSGGGLLALERRYSNSRRVGGGSVKKIST